MSKDELLVTFDESLYKQVDLPTNSIKGTYKVFKNCIVTHLIA
ncbi:hypothetical protein BMG_6296 (plasmid) [Priestia megaterium]|nr:hypothetical protein BMG_6296 [Priestia megaterium]